MTHYELLGVPRDADVATIRLAYRKLAKTCHPDVCRDAGAEERFKRLGEAVDVLTGVTSANSRYFYDLAIGADRTCGGDSLFWSDLKWEMPPSGDTLTPEILTEIFRRYGLKGYPD